MQNPGWLFTNNYGLGYQPEYGYPKLHFANVPSATSGAGGIAEITGQQAKTYGTYSKRHHRQMVSSTMEHLKSHPNDDVRTTAVTSLTIEGNVPITPARPSIQAYYWNGTTWVNRTHATAGIAVTSGLRRCSRRPKLRLERKYYAIHRSQHNHTWKVPHYSKGYRIGLERYRWHGQQEQADHHMHTKTKLQCGQSASNQQLSRSNTLHEEHQNRRCSNKHQLHD